MVDGRYRAISAANRYPDATLIDSVQLVEANSIDVESAFGLAVAADLEQRTQAVVEGLLPVGELPRFQQGPQFLFGSFDRGVRLRSAFSQLPQLLHRRDKIGLEALARAAGTCDPVRRDVALRA